MNIPLSEYPRPQMKRDSYLCLNGLWDLQFISDGKEAKAYPILVPYSPESVYSGVKRTLQPYETMRYSRHVVFPEPVDFQTHTLLLHFGAVDYRALIYINGQQVFEHIGGYLPFEVEVPCREFNLDVLVQDPGDTKEISRGKQSSTPGGIWYPQTSGIWQSVWMEKVPRAYIKNYKLAVDLQGFDITVFMNDNSACPCILNLLGKEYEFKAGTKTRIDIPNAYLWTPEDPYLYDFVITANKDLIPDKVEGYVGLRTFGIGKDENSNNVLLLNKKPYFHHGLLDQGYYKDGFYTPKSDEDFINDIKTAKALGFNTLRKHIKVEPLRWYYHCDRLGMLVWQDMVSGGGKYKTSTVTLPLILGSHLKDNQYEKFARSDEHERQVWEQEAYATVDHLYNVVSLAMWVPFNEGWGQFDSARIVKNIKALDDSRSIDHASGWQDQGIGDFKSLHVYFRPYRFHKDKLGRCVILTEFGGYGYDTNTTQKKSFIYKKLRSKAELTQAIVNLYEKQILPAKNKGLAAAIYTQLSDVEQETNGLITYDRKEIKVLSKTILEMSKSLLS